MTAAVDLPPAVCVTEPGVYADIPELNYHADPVPERSLSHSGAKLLLKAPALFKYRQDNPQPPKRQFDIGHAAHKEVLGVGLDIVVIPGDRWDTKDAKARVAEARAAGQIPVKQDELDQVRAMAAQLRAHPIANRLLSADRGMFEASAFARDPETNVMLRCRYDHLPHPTASGRLIIVDYKTTSDGGATAGAFGRFAATYGYPQQHAWYVDVVRHLGLADDVAMVFVCQEKEPPYLPNVIELPPDAVAAGREKNKRAIRRYVQCMTEDQWPGYPNEVALARIPGWYFYEDEDADA